MALPTDLQARHVAVAARMAIEELDELDLAGERSAKLRRLLNGLASAAADLADELAPGFAAPAPTALTLPDRGCGVFDLHTRRRIA